MKLSDRFALSGIMILLMIISFTGCSTATEQQQLKATPARAIVNPYGSWYTYNRHMHIGQKDRFLTDALKGKEAESKKKYQILSLVQRAEGIYLITLASETSPRPEKRIFSLSRNHQSMRELSGNHVILWTRVP